MSARGWFRVIAKEVRAVAPMCAAIALAMLVGTNAPHNAYQYLLQGIGVAAFFVGPSALGASTFGHEFAFGTWPMLLTLPVSRRRLLSIKFAVLSALLCVLFAWEAWLGIIGESRQFSAFAAILPFVLGAIAAPWLTLATRRAIGGCAFAVAIPGTLLVLGQIVGIRLYGPTGNVDIVVQRFLFWGVLIVCAAGAILGPRRFLRLEVVDGDAPRERSAAPRRAAERSAVADANPVWNLFAKELRLQRLTFGVAAFYLIGYCISALIAGPRVQPGAIIGLLTVAYGTLLAMVTGAIASAEERQLGTLESELLLPVSIARQWSVKAATALVLAAVLGYGMPGLLFRLMPIPIVSVDPLFAGYVVVLAAVTLYVSSVSRSTLSAVILAFPVYLVMAMLFNEIAGPVTRFGFTHVRGSRGDPASGYALGVTALVVLIAIVTALVVWLAHTNHRYADRSVLRIAAHAAVLIAALTAGLAVLGALGIR